MVMAIANGASRFHGRHAHALDVSAWSAAIIAVGFVGCVLGGLAARRVGSARVAFVQLLCSALCCLLSPWLLDAPPMVMLRHRQLVAEKTQSLVMHSDAHNHGNNCREDRNPVGQR